MDRIIQVDQDEEVVLVDEHDRELGTLAKLVAHRTAIRHRAFSVFISDASGRQLLQSRARTKYHSGGLWTNACCGHPRVGESAQAGAERRLFEEMGLYVPLEPAGRINYTAALPDGWHENEVVHLFVGQTADVPAPAAEEVEGWRWVAPERLAEEMARDPFAFTAWFRIYAEQVPHLALGSSDKR